MQHVEKSRNSLHRHVLDNTRTRVRGVKFYVRPPELNVNDRRIYLVYGAVKLY